MRLGSIGWDDPRWADSWYPADMPEAWRLTFFNTQFGCVYLPEKYWRQADGESLKRWADDTHDQFLFLLEGKRDETAPVVFAGRAMILPADDAAICWFDMDSDLKALADRLKGQAKQIEYLISRDGHLGQIERVRILLELLGY